MWVISYEQDTKILEDDGWHLSHTDGDKSGSLPSAYAVEDASGLQFFLMTYFTNVLQLSQPKPGLSFNLWIVFIKSNLKLLLWRIVCVKSYPESCDSELDPN